METLSYAFADGVSIARRNVIKVIRVPQILVAVLVTPIIMVIQPDGWRLSRIRLGLPRISER